MQLKINKKILKELEVIAKNKGQTIKFCLNQAIREWLMQEASLKEAMKLAGDLI